MSKLAFILLHSTLLVTSVSIPGHLSSSCIHLVMGDSPPPIIQSLRGSRPEPVLSGSSCSETKLQRLSCAITLDPAEPGCAI